MSQGQRGTDGHDGAAAARQLAASHLLLRWTTLVLARLDAVVEEQGGEAAVLDAVAATARERADHVRLLLPFLDDPALAAAWRRHCDHVGRAAGADVSDRLAAVLADAVHDAGGAASTARLRAGRVRAADGRAGGLTRTRRRFAVTCGRVTGRTCPWLAA